MATEKQINYIAVLAEQREVPEGFTADSAATMDTAEASRTIGWLLKQPVKEGTAVATEREKIGSVVEGVYTLTAKQAATVLNYKGEPYFGAEKVTVKVSRTKSGAFWLEQTKPVSHPVKDSTARRSVMLLLAKKSPAKA